MDLSYALDLLESDNDDHWTNDGQPRVEIVSDIMGTKVTREEITAFNPEFKRLSDESEPEVEPEPKEVPSQEFLTEQLKAIDTELGELSLEAARIGDKIRLKTIERQGIDRLVTQEFNHQVDQDRRMNHIRLNNERRMKAALEKEALMKKLDPRVLAEVGAPIDHAAPKRKSNAKVPPRIFDQSLKE